MTAKPAETGERIVRPCVTLAFRQGDFRHNRRGRLLQLHQPRTHGLGMQPNTEYFFSANRLKTRKKFSPSAEERMRSLRGT